MTKFSRNVNEREAAEMAKCEIPVWEKSNLTLEEAAAYFNIGVNKLRDLTDDKNCSFVLWVGTKRLIKKTALENYLSKQYSI